MNATLEAHLKTQIPEADYLALRERSQVERRDLRELMQEWFGAQVVPDVFPADEECLDKQRTKIAQLQTKLDQDEAAALAKLDSFRSAVSRRDDLTKRIARAKEQLAELRAAIPDQKERIESSIGNTSMLADDGAIHILGQKVQFLTAYETAIPIVEAWIEKHEPILVEAVAAVEQFEKTAK